jgi:hypothetical protein
MKVINLLQRRDCVVAKSFTVIPVVSPPPTRCMHYLLFAFKSREDQSDALLVSAGDCLNKHRLINSDLLKILNLLFVYFYTLEKYKHNVSAMVFNALQAVRFQIFST